MVMKFLYLTILDRYLLRDIFQSLGAVLLVLLLILLSSRFARFLKNAADGEWPVDVVMPMLGLAVFNSITLIMPAAVFLAVILTVGRFYRNNEMVVITGCGVSMLRLCRPLGMLAISLGVVLGIMAFYVIPVTKYMAASLQDQAVQKSTITGILPGRFQDLSRGSRVIYVERENAETEEVENVFVYSKDADDITLTTASSAYRYEEPDTGDTLIVLKDGYNYNGVPGETGFRSIRFDLQRIRIHESGADDVRLDYETRPTVELLTSSDPFDKAELHWRIAATLSPVLFTLLGLPLGRLQPREGRYGRIMTGVLVYIIYFKLLRVTQVLMEREAIPSWLGMWWVHLGLMVYLVWNLRQASYIRASGWQARRRLARADSDVHH